MTSETVGCPLAMRILACIVLALSLALMSVPGAVAQTASDEGTRFEQWNSAATNARAQIGTRPPKELPQRIAELEAIRTQIAANRDRALVLSRMQPFEADVAERKLALLGAPPEKGESEFAAGKRQALEERLYDLRATQRAAEDSYIRSVATVAQLDERIETLKRSLLFRRGQTPLLPSSWMAFSSETAEKFTQLTQPPEELEEIRIENRWGILLVVVFATLIGFGFAVAVRRRAVARIEARYDPLGAPAKSAALAITRDITALLLLLLGWGIIVAASVLLTALYPTLASLPLMVLGIGAPILLASWLGSIIFAPDTPALRMINLGDKAARRAVWFMLAIGFALGLETLVEYADEESPYSGAASGVPSLLMMLLLGGAIYGLARTISHSRPKLEVSQLSEGLAAEEQFIQSRIDWAALVTGAMKLSAIAAVALALAGYGSLARFAVLPTIETLALIALLTVIYLRIVEFFGFLPPLDFTKSRNALTGAKFALALLFIGIGAPLIAMFWGVRPAEIADFLILLRDGVTIGDTTISLGTVFVFFGVFVLGYVLTRWTQRALQTMLLTRLDMDEGTKSAIVTGTGYLGVMIAFVAAVGAAGIDLSNLAIIFGALSVGIGFGMQSVVSNFVSGIIMLVERPIKEGDSIVVGEYAGIVDKISVRATRIQSFDHDDVIIPNSELIAGTVRNRTLTDRLTRVECMVGIAYDADVNKAFDILYEVANSHERMVSDPPPNVLMEQLGDSALILRLLCFIDEVGKGPTVRSEMNVEIVRRFAEAGISIPFPQRDLHFVGGRPAD